MHFFNVVYHFSDKKVIKLMSGLCKENYLEIEIEAKLHYCRPVQQNGCFIFHYAGFLLIFFFRKTNNFFLIFILVIIHIYNYMQNYH